MKNRSKRKVKRLAGTLRCERPDRDVPGIKCGYPLPCPHHTVVIEGLLVGEPRHANLRPKQRQALHDISYELAAAQERGAKR